MSPKLFTVGKIANTHGIRGELKIYPQTDFPEQRFAKGSELVLCHPQQPVTLPVKVRSARLQKNMYIIQFEGFQNISEVEKYKGWDLKVSEEHREELGEDEFYYQDIIGCKVVTDEGAELGVISEILSPGANDVWVVQPSKGKPILIPYIDEVVLQVNVADKLVKIHVMEGLLD